MLIAALCLRFCPTGAEGMARLLADLEVALPKARWKVGEYDEEKLQIGSGSCAEVLVRLGVEHEPMLELVSSDDVVEATVSGNARHEGRPMHNWIEAEIETRKRPMAAESAEALVRGIAQRGGVIWARACTLAEFDAWNVVMEGQNRSVVGVDVSSGIPGLYWVSYIGSEYRPLVDAEGLAAAGAETCGGGWLLKTAARPQDWDSSEARATRQDLRRAIGDDRVFDKRRPGRRLRTPDWPKPPSRAKR